MRRVMIVGSPGSGKSTLARGLGQKLRLPVCHLDRLYTREGRKLPLEAWKELTRAWTQRDAWVIDGNYLATLELRYARADTLVLLDLPRVLCLWRVLRRSLDVRTPSGERVPSTRSSRATSGTITGASGGTSRPYHASLTSGSSRSAPPEKPTFFSKACRGTDAGALNRNAGVLKTTYFAMPWGDD